MPHFPPPGQRNNNLPLFLWEAIQQKSWKQITQLFIGIVNHLVPGTAKKMKFSIEDLSSKCDQISRKLRIWSHLMEKSLMENFIFCEFYCPRKGQTYLRNQI